MNLNLVQESNIIHEVKKRRSWYTYIFNYYSTQTQIWNRFVTIWIDRYLTPFFFSYSPNKMKKEKWLYVEDLNTDQAFSLQKQIQIIF